jgi:hypothetical protein
MYPVTAMQRTVQASLQWKIRVQATRAFAPNNMSYMRDLQQPNTHTLFFSHDSNTHAPHFMIPTRTRLFLHKLNMLSLFALAQDTGPCASRVPRGIEVLPQGRHSLIRPGKSSDTRTQSSVIHCVTDTYLMSCWRPAIPAALKQGNTRELRENNLRTRSSDALKSCT